MELDMYLNNHVYIGAHFPHRKVTGNVDIKIEGKEVDIDFDKISTIIVKVAYWRKANQIHNWFVNNVQEGKDDCQEYYVSYDKLMELKKLCEKALADKNSDLLKPVEGFFFGGTEIDKFYWDDIKYTISALEKIEICGSYYYQSSW